MFLQNFRLHLSSVKLGIFYRKMRVLECKLNTSFDNSVHSLVDCEGLTFDVNLLDIDTLNISSAEGIYDICKLSYHAYYHLLDKYIMLRSGSALGYNNGPLLVAKKRISPVFRKRWY